MNEKFKRERKASKNADQTELLRQVFEEAMSKALGASAKDALIYHITNKLRGDPFQILYNNPAAFYNALFTIFGQGTNLIIKLLAQEINKKYEAEISAETLLQYITSEDKTLTREWQQQLLTKS